jgi:hypothetical protein
MDRRSLVGAVVVQHQMNIEVGWHFGVNSLQKAEELWPEGVDSGG